MNRSVTAFVVAPLCVPVIVAPCVAVVVFLHSGEILWPVIGTVISSAIFTYVGMLAFGLPAFLILRSRQLTDLWIAAVLGFAFGALTWAVWRVWFAAHSLGQGIAGVWLALRFTAVDAAWLFGPGLLLGLIVGVTFWLIARPDRIEPRLL